LALVDSRIDCVIIFPIFWSILELDKWKNEFWMSGSLLLAYWISKILVFANIVFSTGKQEAALFGSNPA
jgi:hypothetical protein